MRIEAITPNLVSTPGNVASAAGVGATTGSPESVDSPPFGGSLTGQALTDAIEEVNQLQFDADRSVEDLALGRADSIHEAVIALEKASTALQFTIQVTKKAVEAYQEIIRMPV